MNLRDKVLKLEKLENTILAYKLLEENETNPNKADYWELKKNETKELHDELLKDIINSK